MTQKIPIDKSELVYYNSGMKKPKTNPWSPVQGQTNSANPTSLKKLEDAYTVLEKTKEAFVPAMPLKPTKQVPNIEKRYKQMGEIIGICPYELKAILNSSFGEHETLVITLLKKFVTAAKLSGSVDLVSINKMLKEAEDRHQKDLQEWKDHSRKIASIQKKHKQDVEEKQKAFSLAWGNILIDLVTKLSRNNNLHSLGDMDQLTVLAIARTGSKYCKVVKNKVELDFNECKKMPPDLIVNLQSVAATIKSEQEYRIWVKWLKTASIEELKNELYKSEMGIKDLSFDKVSDITMALSEKLGIQSAIDEYGNTEYFYSKSNYDDSWDPWGGY